MNRRPAADYATGRLPMQRLYRVRPGTWPVALLVLAVGQLFDGARPVLVGASLGGITSLIALGRGDDVGGALVLVDVAPKLEREGVERVGAFMRSGVEGFDSLEQVADMVAELAGRHDVHAVGVAAAYLYSVLAIVAPGAFPHGFAGHDGEIGVYFEAAAVIVTLILVGRWLEARAKGRAGAAIGRAHAASPSVRVSCGLYTPTKR